MFNLNLILVVLSFNIVFILGNNDTTLEDFIPSKEWQVVRPNQKIPPGLHVRSNLQTGITEAKILDNQNNEDKDTGMILLKESKNTTDEDISKNYTPEQLKIMLKNIKDDSHIKDVTSDSVEINGTKFRSFHQLKEDLASIQSNFKTDLEIIRELMNELQTNIDNNKKLIILQDLEYYLHQIDNAQNFVDMGGLSILHSYIDGDEYLLKSEAFRCLASALQSNAKVKVEAIKNGTLSRLLVQLELSNDITMINRILAAISSITRHFPVAQVAFVNGGGVSLIGKIFDHYSALSDIKITLKLVTLISDWLKERNIDVNLQQEDIVERQNQFKKVDINAILLNEGWCVRLGQMLSTRSDLSIDYYEKVIHSVVNIYPICQSGISENQLLSFLDHANIMISQLAKSSSDSDDFYVIDMVKLVEQATTLVKSKIGHNEL